MKTELYFRQVLGRILRSTGVEKNEGFLFIPAEPNLVEYAERVVENIPDANTIAIELMTGGITASDEPAQPPSLSDKEKDQKPIEEVVSPIDLASDGELIEFSDLQPLTLAESYDASIGFFGRFRQEIINLSMRDFPIEG